jgi:NADH pyrophosphatase NudC (nudix superfamily)
MALAPQIAVLFALTTAVGWLMILAGIGKHSLDWRRGRRFCPGCGRERTDRGCGCG